MNRKTEWLKLTVAEALPVVCHADLKGCELRPENHKRGAAHPGPFYASGSTWYEADHTFGALKVAKLRENGYTVTVEVV